MKCIKAKALTGIQAGAFLMERRKTMKKRLLSAAVISVLVMGLCGCAGSEDLVPPTSSSAQTPAGTTTDAEQTSADNSGDEDTFTLRVAMECSYAPFNWSQEEQTVAYNGATAEPIFGSDYYAYGYDVMVAQKICDYYGWNLEIHKAEWSSIILGLQSDEYDAIIAGMKYTEDRDKSVDFTDAYYFTNNCLIVRADSPYADKTKLSDFTGISATAQINSAYVDYLYEIPDVNVQPFYDSVSESVMAVQNGVVEACVCDVPTAMSMCATNSNITYIVFDEDDTWQIPEGMTNELCIAVREGDADLQDKLNVALKAINWDQTAMDEAMDVAVKAQPANAE